MTVWAEGVFFLNAALDYALMAGAVRLRGGSPPKRLIPAALLGGALAVAALFPPLRDLPVGIIGFFLLTACAFGLTLEGLRMGLVFLGLSLALCGIQTALAELLGSGMLIRKNGILLLVSWRGLFASAALLYGVCAVLSGAVRSRKRLLLPVQVTAAGKTLRFRSLSDTGSFLRDPLTGKPVVLADSSIARSLLGIGEEQLRQPAQLLEQILREQPELRPRLIPYSAIGVERGMLLGIRCQELLVGKQSRDGGILAFSPGEVSDDGSYHGLTGG